MVYYYSHKCTMCFVITIYNLCRSLDQTLLSWINQKVYQSDCRVSKSEIILFSFEFLEEIIMF